MLRRQVQPRARTGPIQRSTPTLLSEEYGASTGENRWPPHSPVPLGHSQPRKKTKQATAPKDTGESGADEEESGEEMRECVVCMDGPATKIICPCLHKCLCDGCAARVNKRNGIVSCPQCRQEPILIATADQIYS